jgi:hypothetical protein
MTNVEGLAYGDGKGFKLTVNQRKPRQSRHRGVSIMCISVLGGPNLSELCGVLRVQSAEDRKTVFWAKINF